MNEAKLSRKQDTFRRRNRTYVSKAGKKDLPKIRKVGNICKGEALITTIILRGRIEFKAAPHP